MTAERPDPTPLPPEGPDDDDSDAAALAEDDSDWQVQEDGDESSLDAGEAAALDRPGADPLEASLGGDELPELTESMHLLLEAQKGDEQALNDLLARYHDRIQRIIRVKMSYRLRRCVETIDIVQDAFAKAARAIDTLELRSTASILQWLARIAENQMHDVYRRHYGLKRDKRREVRMASGGRDKDDSHPGVTVAARVKEPGDVAATEELRALVDEGVSKLPDDYREVIMLRTYYGVSWEWVAQQMGRPGADAARQLHRRARIRLSRLLRDKLPDLPEIGGKGGD